EMACDDMVLAQTGNPRGYAECLVSLAEKSFVRRGLAMAQAVIGGARDTSLRLARILDRNRPGSTRVFKPVLAGVTPFGGLFAVANSNAPTLIAFRSSVPAIASMASDDVPVLSKNVVVPASVRLSATPSIVGERKAAPKQVKPVPTIARNANIKVKTKAPQLI